MNCGTPQIIWENRSRNRWDRPDRVVDWPCTILQEHFGGAQFIVTSCGTYLAFSKSNIDRDRSVFSNVREGNWAMRTFDIGGVGTMMFQN